MVDKILVKDYVKDVIGSEYVIPLLGVWDKPEDINWDSLPNRFVLKTNHSGGSTGVFICEDKATLDIDDVVRKIRSSLRSDIYHNFREWPYKNINRKVFAEEYIDPDPVLEDLPDYKFFCFNGEPKFCQVISGREKKMCIDFFDHNWIHQPFHEPKLFPFADVEPQKPIHYEKMWNAASQLAQGKPFCRIDFYQSGDIVLFGEITFYPTSGMGGFDPPEYDYELGNMIDINGMDI